MSSQKRRNRREWALKPKPLKRSCVGAEASPPMKFTLLTVECHGDTRQLCSFIWNLLFSWWLSHTLPSWERLVAQPQWSCKGIFPACHPAGFFWWPTLAAWQDYIQEGRLQWKQHVHVKYARMHYATRSLTLVSSGYSKTDIYNQVCRSPITNMHVIKFHLHQ